VNIIRFLLVLPAVVILFACQFNSVKSNDPHMPSNEYLNGKDSTIGVVLCHGRGKHPTWFVVDPLRKGINHQLGYHTLSIQMPTGDIDWSEYEFFFPEAHKRIDSAVRFLKNTKHVKTVYLMGHSMGSRMATSYLADNPNSGIAGFIGVGVRNGGDGALDSDSNLRRINIPVLDVYGDGGDGKDADDADVRSDMVDKNYRQVLIPDADHKFTMHEKEMVNSVVSWLKSQL